MKLSAQTISMHYYTFYSNTLMLMLERKNMMLIKMKIFLSQALEITCGNKKI